MREARESNSIATEDSRRENDVPDDSFQTPQPEPLMALATQNRYAPLDHQPTQPQTAELVAARDSVHAIVEAQQDDEDVHQDEMRAAKAAGDDLRLVDGQSRVIQDLAFSSKTSGELSKTEQVTLGRRTILTPEQDLHLMQIERPTVKRVMSIELLKSLDTSRALQIGAPGLDHFECARCKKLCPCHPPPFDTNNMLCPNCESVDGRIDRAQAVMDDLEQQYDAMQLSRTQKRTRRLTSTGRHDLQVMTDFLIMSLTCIADPIDPALDPLEEDGNSDHVVKYDQRQIFYNFFMQCF